MTPVDIAVSVLAKLLEYTARPVVQPLDYIFHHNTNIDGLKNRILCLENTRFGVQRQVQIAERNGDIVLPNVQDWLAKANGLATESQNFLSDEVDRNHRCFSGSCPDLKLIYKSSKEAKKKGAAVDELVERGKFDYVSQPARRPPIWPSIGVAATTSLGDLDGFESRKSQLRLIMEALEDDNVNIIGVYGMGGIGKTTFVEEVARQADAHQLFDEMVMMVVSHKPNLRKLQGDLAEMLELNLKEEGELLRTARLRERLNQVKRILIILDDVWTPLDLRSIGIPQDNLHKGCKIILTSRSLDVCNAMNAQTNFHMDVLSQVESWNLFRKMAGDSVDATDLNPIATKVAKRCSGLPLAIVTVARALRHRSKHAWRDALRQLSNSSRLTTTTNDVKGMYSNIFASLELSFNFLKDEESKSCFLLCSLFKEDLDIPIEYLVRYGTGLRVFQDVHTLEEARDRVHTIIENLKACCLLLDSDVEGCFRMHDVTRDFLLSVVSRGLYIFLEKMMPGYLDSPNQNNFSNSYAISLVLNGVQEFPIGVHFPKLQLWRVEGCNSMELMQFSGNFFDGMKELKVVLMHYVSIPSIPSSFLSLKKLLTLCLEHCKLGDLSQVKELKNLEILSFMNSDIEKLPKEIGQLSRLRLLDLTDCNNLTVIPFGVFSNLSNLECLYMMNSFDQWGFDGQSQSQATLGELKHLFHLTTLEMHIPDANLFPKDVLFGNLVRFKIFVGMASQVITFSYPKTLTLALYQDLSLHNGICELLKVSQHVILDYSIVDYLEELNNIVYDLRKGFRHLKCLEVYGYTGVESLIDTNIFPVLESLKVVSASDLKTICYDHLPDESFCELRELMLSILPELTCLWMDPLRNVCLRNLRTLYVSNCHKLKEIVSQSTAGDLSELQKLYVSSCEDLKVILSKDEVVSRIALPKLKSIKLEFLSSLESFCPEADSVQEPLFNSKVDFPSLEELTLRELHSVKEIWSHQQLSASNFHSLRILIVFGCDKLHLVFPSYIQHMLQNLEILSVEWCDLVQDVCQLNSSIQNDATLPSVRDLNLGKLPLLKHLWWNMNMGTNLKNLNSLHIYECDALIHLFSFHAIKNLVQLQHLKVRSCKMMKTIFSIEGDDDIVLSELCSVDLEDLPQLSSFCHGSTSLEFPLLEMIEIKTCPKLKAFVASDVHQDEKLMFNEKVSLPNLQSLQLDGLNSLKGIWHTKLPEKSFTKLQVLEVINCEQLLNLGPINLTPRLQMLEVIHLTNCLSLEEIFTLKPHQNLSSVSLTKLVNLVLENLPKLRHIWWCPNKTHRYQRLASLEVSKCDLLDCIFTSSVARGVPRLQKLKVDSCMSVEVIIGNNQSDDLILPQICTIELENLPNLVSFCGRASALKWLSLKELRILNCSKMVATSNSIEAFFGEKVVFPSLENVRIDSIGCVNTVRNNARNCQNLDVKD